MFYCPVCWYAVVVDVVGGKAVEAESQVLSTLYMGLIGVFYWIS